MPTDVRTVGQDGGVYVQILDELRTDASTLCERQRRWGVWWRGVSMWLGIPAAVLAAAAGVTGLVESHDLSVALAFAAATISAVLAFTTPDQRAAQASSLATRCEAFEVGTRLKRERIPEMTPDEAEATCTEASDEWRRIRDDGSAG